MQLVGYTFFGGVLDALLSVPGGGMDLELVRQGERIAKSARDYLDTPQPEPRPRVAYNGPPGPPMRGFGWLQDSVGVIGPFQFGGLPETWVTIGSFETQKGTWNYAHVLKDRGYEFVNLEDLTI